MQIVQVTHVDSEFCRATACPASFEPHQANQVWGSSFSQQPSLQQTTTHAPWSETGGVQKGWDLEPSIDRSVRDAGPPGQSPTNEVHQSSHRTYTSPGQDRDAAGEANCVPALQTTIISRFQCILLVTGQSIIDQPEFQFPLIQSPVCDPYFLAVPLLSLLQDALPMQSPPKHRRADPLAL